MKFNHIVGKRRVRKIIVCLLTLAILGGVLYGIWCLGNFSIAWFSLPIIETWWTEFLVGLVVLAIIIMTVVVVCYAID
ncbi:hypothetical protein ES703_121241 [subsurface metagenome]